MDRVVATAVEFVEVIEIADDVGVVASAAIQIVNVTEAAIEGVIAAIADQRIDAPKAAQYVCGAVAADDVVETVAIGIECAGSGQRDVLDIGDICAIGIDQRNARRNFEPVVTRIGEEDQVGAVDDIDVVARAALSISAPSAELPSA